MISLHLSFVSHHDIEGLHQAYRYGPYKFQATWKVSAAVEEEWEIEYCLPCLRELEVVHWVYSSILTNGQMYEAKPPDPN